MGKWGKADFKQFRQLQKNIEDLSKKTNMDAFCQKCCKELAGRLLALVIPATPVGTYPPSTGKKGGTLRRGWGVDSAGAAATYAQSLTVTKAGTNYQVEVINPVDYASYVEFGHRTRGGGGSGWVEGRHMLTISEDKLRKMAPKMLERELQAYLKEVFNV